MPREMLRARHHEMLLTSLDPGRRVRADDARIGAECARLDDRIPGLDVEVAHRGEDPGEAARPGPEAGAEEQRPLGEIAERARECPDCRSCAAEQNEAADTRGERLLDLGAFGLE